MAVCATSVLVIFCRKKANTGFLANVWRREDVWCGFKIAHAPTIKKDGKTILVLVWGGELHSSEVPEWVTRIKLGPDSASLPKACHRASVIFERKGQCSSNGQKHSHCE